MDADKLRKQRQLNVQEQNFLMRQQMLDCALAYARREPALAWVEAALKLNGIDACRGALLKAASVPCGGGEEAAYAEWVAEDREFYSLEATIRMCTHELISVDQCRNVTASTTISAHHPGTGKTAGYLALEVLEQIRSA
jgi:hypothetical protein